MKMKNDYFKILSIYNKANLKEIEKVSGYSNWFNIGIVLYIIIAISTIILSDSKYKNLYITFEGIILFIFIFILFKKIKTKFREKYNLEDDSFLKQNKLYWRGERALIFFNEIKKSKVKLESKKILKIIDKELELKKFEILKMPFLVGSFIVLGMIFDNIFSKIDLNWLLLCLVINIIVIDLYWDALSILRTEESKMNDLKLFIHWHDSFGKELTNNNLEKDIIK